MFEISEFQFFVRLSWNNIDGLSILPFPFIRYEA